MSSAWQQIWFCKRKHDDMEHWREAQIGGWFVFSSLGFPSSFASSLGSLARLRCWTEKIDCENFPKLSWDFRMYKFLNFRTAESLECTYVFSRKKLTEGQRRLRHELFVLVIRIAQWIKYFLCRFLLRPLILPKFIDIIIFFTFISTGAWVMGSLLVSLSL